MLDTAPSVEGAPPSPAVAASLPAPALPEGTISAAPSPVGCTSPDLGRSLGVSTSPVVVAVVPVAVGWLYPATYIHEDVRAAHISSYSNAELGEEYC